MATEVTGSALAAWRTQARQQAEAAGVEPQEVDWLLRALSPLDALTLKLGRLGELPAIPLGLPLEELEQRWQQRLQQRVPVQYLAGQTPWRALTLQVSPAVLIPRPETELIIDLAVAASQQFPILQQGLWADLGTGSGAIALGLAQALPAATILAVDQSSAALTVAQANAEAAGLTDRIHFHQGSWFSPLGFYRGQIAAMVANPPYIPTGLLSTLAPEVIDHEPRPALDGGMDGLDSIRTLVAQAPDYLQPGGLWLVEMMLGQGAAVLALLAANGAYRDGQMYQDLAGCDRFTQAWRC
ncbi:MAG: peptide chain release factor N(5)-glutamine methyltransferase [Nodosilinea sp.]